MLLLMKKSISVLLLRRQNKDGVAEITILPNLISTMQLRNMAGILLSMLLFGKDLLRKKQRLLNEN